MKTTSKTITRTIVNVLLFSALSLSAFAQKLVNVQEVSLRAPANVKIDGKLGEWGDSFQAMNRNTNLFYTVANDDVNVYFVIKSTDQMNSNKILGGGVSFTINTQNKKSEKEAYQVVLPVDLQKLSSMMMSARSSTNGAAPDSAALEAMRHKAASAFKDINLVNFKGIPDSVLSIYNEYGIRAFVDFDKKGALIMELAVPLKEMKMDATSSFNYNIKLPGINITAMMNAAMASAGGMDNMRAAAAQAAQQGGGGNFGGGGGIPRNMGDMANIVSPTDFWGKYQLIKK